jgi:hypothetical protein
MDKVPGRSCDTQIKEILTLKIKYKNRKELKALDYWDNDYHKRKKELEGEEALLNSEYNNDLERAAKDDYLVFDADTLSTYLIFKSRRQGMTNLSTILSILKDTYEAELRIYKDVKEKYPEHLATYHDQVTYKVNVMNNIEEKDEYEKEACKAKQFEGEYKDYILMALTTIDDVIDEATQQSNCVKTYIQHVIDGRCQLMALRKKSAPSESLVTVEVRNGVPVQYLREHNRSTTAADRIALFTIMQKAYEKQDTEEAKEMAMEMKKEAIANGRIA